MSAKAFMRYVRARADDADRREVYRIYVAKHLQLIAGTDLGYYEIVHGGEPADFDADEVVDDVLSRMGLEEGA